MADASLAIPQALLHGQEFHRAFQRAYADGLVSASAKAEHPVPLSTGIRGRTDLFLTAGGPSLELDSGNLLSEDRNRSVTVYEAKSCDWEAPSNKNWRSIVAHHIEQLEGYLNHALCELDDWEYDFVQGCLVYERQPRDEGLAADITSEVFQSDTGIVALWFDELIAEDNVRRQQDWKRRQEMAQRLRQTARFVAALALPESLRTRLILDPAMTLTQVADDDRYLVTDLRAQTRMLADSGCGDLIQPQLDDALCSQQLCKATCPVERAIESHVAGPDAGCLPQDTLRQIASERKAQLSPRACQRLREPSAFCAVLPRPPLDHSENKPSLFALLERLQELGNEGGLWQLREYLAQLQVDARLGTGWKHRKDPKRPLDRKQRPRRYRFDRVHPVPSRDGSHSHIAWVCLHGAVTYVTLAEVINSLRAGERWLFRVGSRAVRIVEAHQCPIEGCDYGPYVVARSRLSPDILLNAPTC